MAGRGEAAARLSRRLVSCALVFALASAVPAAHAEAFHGGAHFATCANNADTDCVVSIRVGTTNGAGGAAAPASVTVDAWFQAGLLQGPQLRNNGDYELNPVITTATEVTITLRLATFVPSVVIGTGNILNWTWSAVAKELTVVVKPVSASMAATCSPSNCPDNALFDNASTIRLAADDGVLDGVPPDMAADFAAFMAKYRGGYVATNAQYFSAPSLHPFTKALFFGLGAPHFKADGTTVNTGFFTVLIPDPVIADEWGKDPATLNLSSVSVTVGTTPTTFTLTRVTGRAPFPDGWLVQNQTPIGFSTPEVSIAPAGVASVPPPGPPSPPADNSAPPTLPESSSGGAVDAMGPVRIPLSGAIRVPVTVSGAGASIAFAPGTELTTANGQRFSGDIQPPYRLADPSGRGLESVTNVIATGAATADRTVRLSRPATLTLAVPAGSSASDFQPVALDAAGNVTYLRGRSGGAGVSIDISTLSDAVAPYALARIPKPAAVAVERSVPTEPGLHARWAGQSPAVALSPGQLSDVSVRLVNTGDQPWVRGTLGSQANLGSGAPAGNTRDFDSGVLAAPLWGRDRFATTAESLVRPGEVGTFSMRLRAPATTGTHRVYLRPVVDGAAWLEDEGIFVELVVR